MHITECKFKHLLVYCINIVLLVTQNNFVSYFIPKNSYCIKPKVDCNLFFRADSGFRRVEAKKYSPRLLHVFGERVKKILFSI